MQRPSAQIRVGGYWLGIEFPCTPPTVVTTWGDEGSGTFEIAWNVDLPAGARHPALRRGRLVEVVESGVVLESGILEQPDWRTGDMVAAGLFRQAERFAAENNSGEHGTSRANVAVDNMIARATTHTTRPNGLRAAKMAETEDTDALVYVSDVLAAAARFEGKRWGVDPGGRWFLTADPESPKWLLAPGVAELEPTGQDYAATVKVRYKSDEAGGAVQTVTSTDTVARDYWGPSEAVLDARSLGKIPDADAASLAQQVRRKTGARLRWVGSVEVGPSQLLTIGGLPADLRAVRAGDMVRIPVGFSDIADTKGQLWLDVVIGRTEHTYGTEVLTLEPVDMAPRSPLQVMERLVRRMEKQIRREQKLLEK